MIHPLSTVSLTTHSLVDLHGTEFLGSLELPDVECFLGCGYDVGASYSDVDWFLKMKKIKKMWLYHTSTVKHPKKTDLQK